MANAVWPITLPQVLLLEGFSSAPPQNFISTPMEVGQAKRRRRDVAAVYPVQGNIHCTAAQLATLWAFYRTTLADGSLRFDWTEPVTGNAATYLFKEPFAYVAVGGGRYRVSLSLEAQP